MSPNGAEAKAAAGKEANWIYTPLGKMGLSWPLLYCP